MALALASDIRVFAASGRMNVAFVRIGLSGCDVGVSHLLPRIAGLGIASELMLTGRQVNAEEAARIGLANRVVADGEEVPAAIQLARVGWFLCVGSFLGPILGLLLDCALFSGPTDVLPRITKPLLALEWRGTDYAIGNVCRAAHDRSTRSTEAASMQGLFCEECANTVTKPPETSQIAGEVTATRGNDRGEAVSCWESPYGTSRKWPRPGTANAHCKGGAAPGRRVLLTNRLPLARNRSGNRVSLSLQTARTSYRPSMSHRPVSESVIT
ncbi:MAG: Enoyl-CoA hydratase/isomerase [Solirubrobacterales bacterium]|nr:Enoyl-CoA hydratase/isomerase [Solirubrobacterales bacterium]